MKEFYTVLSAQVTSAGHKIFARPPSKIKSFSYCPILMIATNSKNEHLINPMKNQNFKNYKKSFKTEK